MSRKRWPWVLGGVVLGGAALAGVALAAGGAGDVGTGGIVWEDCEPVRIMPQQLEAWLSANVHRIVVEGNIRRGPDLVDAMFAELAPEGCAFPPASGTPDGDDYDRLREQFADLYQQIVDAVWAAEGGASPMLTFDPHAVMAESIAATWGR